MSTCIEHSSFPSIAPETAKLPRTRGGAFLETYECLGSPIQHGRIGPYVVECELGRGGMGVVYRARDTRLDRMVALKVILQAGYSDAKSRQRFQDEATAIAKLQHPHIVQVYDVGTQGDVPYMALEYIEQGTLFRKTESKPQEPRYAAYLVAGMADGIQHAHDHGILHRDLKPANILLRSRSGDSSASQVNGQFADVPVISDFGLAKRIDSTEYFTQSGIAIGTPNYMSPEQAYGKKESVGPSSDIYGLGAILYELLTGHPPFQGVSPMDTLLQVAEKEPVPPRQLQPKVPVDLETICLKCLQKSPARRYHSAAELSADLRRFLQNQVILARPTSPGQRFIRWCRRHPSIAALTGIIFLLLSMGTAITGTLAYQSHVRARQLAEEKERASRNLQHARAIIRDYVTEVDNDPVVKEALPLPLKQKLLSKASPALKELLSENQNSPELLEEQAKAHWLLGNIHSLMGQADQAEHAYQASITAGKPLASTRENILHLSNAYLDLGHLRITQGHYPEAIEAIQEAITQANTLPTAPDDARMRNLVRAHLELADVHIMQGNYLEASGDFKRTSQLLATSEAFESHDTRLVLSMQLLIQRAKVEITTLQLNEAEKRCIEARKLADERFSIAQDKTQHLKWKSSISETLARVFISKREFETALQHANGAMESATQLVATQSLAYSNQVSLAIAYRTRALVLKYQGKMDAAKGDLQKSLEMLEHLAQVNPTYRHRRELGAAQAEMGNWCQLTNQAVEGEKLLRTAMETYSELLPLLPGDIDLRGQAATTMNALGNTLLAQKRDREAVEIYERTEKELVELLRLSPKNLSHRIMQGGVSDNLGICYFALNDFEKSKSWYERAMGHLNAVLQTLPNNATTRNYLRIAKKGMGAISLMQDKYEEALKWYEEALSLCVRAGDKEEMLRRIEEAKKGLK